MELHRVGRADGRRARGARRLARRQPLGRCWGGAPAATSREWAGFSRPARLPRRDARPAPARPQVLLAMIEGLNIFLTKMLAENSAPPYAPPPPYQPPPMAPAPPTAAKPAAADEGFMVDSAKSSQAT